MVAKGMEYKQIAERLVISHRTVQNHVQNTLRKLQMHNRVELTRWAIQRGLDEPTMTTGVSAGATSSAPPPLPTPRRCGTSSAPPTSSRWRTSSRPRSSRTRTRRWRTGGGRRSPTRRCASTSWTVRTGSGSSRRTTRPRCGTSPCIPTTGGPGWPARPSPAPRLRSPPAGSRGRCCGAWRTNHRALGLYRHLGWRPTGRERRAEWPPYPIERQHSLAARDACDVAGQAAATRWRSPPTGPKD